MKNVFLLFISCFSLLACSDDDSTTIPIDEKYIEKGSMSVQYNGETLNFNDVHVMPGGPDSGYALELTSVILYDDVKATKYSLVMHFSKDEAGVYTLDVITLGVDDRQGPNSFFLKGYYAYTSGQFAVTGFNHSTTSLREGDEVTVTGNFSGTLAPGNDQPEPIQIKNGQFSATFKPF